MQLYFSNEPPLYAKSRSRPLDRPSAASSSVASTTRDRDHVSGSDQSPAPPRLPPKPFPTSTGAVVTPDAVTSVLGSTPAPSSASPGQSGQSSPASYSQTPTGAYRNYPPHATGTDIRDSVSLPSSSAFSLHPSLLPHLNSIRFDVSFTPLGFSAPGLLSLIHPVSPVIRYLKFSSHILITWRRMLCRKMALYDLLHIGYSSLEQNLRVGPLYSQLPTEVSEYFWCFYLPSVTSFFQFFPIIFQELVFWTCLPLCNLIRESDQLSTAPTSSPAAPTRTFSNSRSHYIVGACANTCVTW